MEPMQQFPYFELYGSPEQIGSLAGSKFGKRIRENFTFYEDFFFELKGVDKSNESSANDFRLMLENLSDGFAEIVRKHFPKFDVEISAMAKSANLKEWQIYLLNARTEIYRKLAQEKINNSPGECTALYFPQSKLLGQNWDWHPKLEELCVVVKITDLAKRSIVMLTEPGIIGKIGLNSEGLGVCLNILFSECEIKGVPIHILLRAVLECSSVIEARKLIESLPMGTTSNLLIADSSGNAVDLELHGEKVISAVLDGGELIHTNHYIGQEDSASASLPGSIQRLKRAKELFSEQSLNGVRGMRTILSDKEQTNFPICRSYSMGLDFMVGTVASVIMDLEGRSLQVAKGPPSENSEWATFLA